jgi:hypothetical protein
VSECSKPLTLGILYIYIYKTPWSRVTLEKLTVIQQFKKFPAFYGTQRFITMFTTEIETYTADTELKIPPY